jgi:hypothetical protein
MEPLSFRDRATIPGEQRQGEVIVLERVKPWVHFAFIPFIPCIPVEKGNQN